MANMGGPPPKRRRTEGVQILEDPVAQANSALKVFMGHNQRQNRWMQGYVPGPEDERVPRQTQPSVAAARAVSDRHPQHVQQRNIAGVTRASAALPTGVSNLVQYESPVTSMSLPGSVPQVMNSASPKPVDRRPSESVVGLPSPVSSDGNLNSPATVFGAPPPRRGRPPSMTANTVPPGYVAAGPNNGSPLPCGPSQTQSLHHPRPQQQPNLGFGNSPTLHNPAMDATSAADPSRGPHMIPGHGHTPLQPGHTGFPSSNQMLQQVDGFYHDNLAKLRSINHVDTGRISLLREAIERQDWFYICLSQIHCLTQTPTLLPQPAITLPMQAITYLDMLLCPNYKLNPTVLKWLSDFPASMKSIYSSQARSLYDNLVQDVVGFIQRLQLGWDHLVNDCKARGSPPLIDDLLDRLALCSPVLQTTVFRAIARMITDGSDHLEQLHRLDQDAFLRGCGKRSLNEKQAACKAFQGTIKKLRCHGQTQSDPRKRFVIPQEALAVFQVRLFAPSLAQAHIAPINHFNPAQKHPPVQINNRSRIRHPSFGTSGSPPQPRAPSIPTPTASILTPPLPTMSMAAAYGNIQMPRQQHQPNRRLLLPHEGEQPRAQPTHPDTMRSALHQAHLRSPTLTPTEPAAPRLYRHVIGYALSPRKINKALPMETIIFDVSQELYDVLPASIPSQQPGAPKSRTLNERTCTIRLRCASGTDNVLKSESAWVEADGYWPDNLFLQCNMHALEPRRKLHHNRYLPIDLTAMVKPGRNELTVIVNRMSTDTRPYEYALAVEIVGVVNHNAIRSSLKHIPAAESLTSIKKALAGSDGDDDISITTSTTIIQLFDPHTLTSIFDIPVRGSACLHKDCFDLETFLSQRDPKNNPGTPSVVDCWRCPICRGDVRPQTLIRDGFMDSVREELAKKNMLHTRAIVVEPDGTWTAKGEDEGGVRSPSLEREERSSSAKASGRAMPAAKVVEVIEID